MKKVIVQNKNTKVVFKLYLFCLLMHFFVNLFSTFQYMELWDSLVTWMQYFARLLSLLAVFCYAFEVCSLAKKWWIIIALYITLVLLYGLIKNGLFISDVSFLSNLKFFMIYFLIALLPLLLTIKLAYKKSD